MISTASWTFSHEEVVFENWMGGRVQGKQNLYQAWAPSFNNHGGFRFTAEDLFADEQAQKGPLPLATGLAVFGKGFEGKPEKRRGVRRYPIPGTGR